MPGLGAESKVGTPDVTGVSAVAASPVDATGVTTPVAVTALPLDETTNIKNINLLIQLRWIAVVGQVLTIGFVHLVMGISLPLMAMVMVLCGSVFLNVISQEWLRQQTDARDRELLLLLLLDVAALTAQLYLSGGATNPFISLYLLQVTLGAMLLNGRSTWVVVVVACLCFAGLIVFHRPLDLPDALRDDLFQLHIIGMLICFVLDAALIVVFMTRIAENLRERDERSGNAAPAGRGGRSYRAHGSACLRRGA
jgi:two-component system sensor histidine kinase RegB